MKKIFGMMVLACAATIVACGPKSNGSITMGSKSQFDSLSYALGVNVGYGMRYMMNDIPFNYDQIEKGVREGALATTQLTSEEIYEMLNNYFGQLRPQRAQAVMAKRAAEKAAAEETAAAEATEEAPEADAEVAVEIQEEPEMPAPDESMFATTGERDSISYAFGVDLGTNMEKSKMPVQLVWFLGGMKDVRNGEARMEESEASQIIQHYMRVVVPQKNKAENEAWLAEIAEEKGVQKTESGLLYRIDEMGDETLKAGPQDRLLVHYKGTNHNGEAFDSSYFEFKPKQMQDFLKQVRPDDYNKDEPFNCDLSRMIPGWIEGLQLVGKGGKITLWIPSELAYGESSRSPLIPANEALKFEVEVIDVMPREVPAAEVAPAN